MEPVVVTEAVGFRVMDSRLSNRNAQDEILSEEFDLARALVEARTAAGLSQSQLARRMKTSRSYIARIEGGKVR